MKIADAIKKVQAYKPKENYLMIRLDYDTHLLLPFKEGMAFMAALVNAEMLTESYGKPNRIDHFDKDMLSSRIMSAQEYQDIKVAQLLQVSVAELRANMEKENEHVAV